MDEDPKFHEYVGAIPLPITLLTDEERSLIARVKAVVAASWIWLFGTIISGVIVGTLIFIITCFYIFSSLANLNTFFYAFLLLSVLTDGIFIFMHVPRRPVNHQDLGFDPSKLTVLIACYNGQDIIGETIDQAKRQVPGHQIIVVSDASTDRSAQVARTHGARVIINPRNINKAFSVSRAMKYVTTPYVLILDDDTHIGDTFIPTSLLDDGYTAVAFNVMPQAEDTFLNSLQQFEYRQSMQMGKNLRAKTGAIGNVSGAIGLFRTQDLLKQVRLHSGQFGGEDEQRTALAHLYGTGKGITYTDSIVTTIAPANLKQLIRQRVQKWNLSLPEMFSIYWRMLLSHRPHYIFKTEKAYQLYIFLTDPLRMLFFWVLIIKPSRLLVSYVFYLFLTLINWFKTKRVDPLWVVLVYPIYSLILSVCRFAAHFYWFKVKFDYLFREKFHRVVTGRKLLAEYALVIVVIAGVWTASLRHFSNEVQALNWLRSHQLQDSGSSFQSSVTSTSNAPAPSPTESLENRR